MTVYGYGNMPTCEHGCCRLWRCQCGYSAGSHAYREDAFRHCNYGQCQEFRPARCDCKRDGCPTVREDT